VFVKHPEEKNKQIKNNTKLWFLINNYEKLKFTQNFIPFEAKKVVSTASVWLWLEKKIELRN